MEFPFLPPFWHIFTQNSLELKWVKVEERGEVKKIPRVAM